MKFNPYFNPGYFGLSIVEEVNHSSTYGKFDIEVTWKHKTTGKVYTARSFGDDDCSEPFEDFNSIENLTEIEDGMENSRI